MSMPIPESVAQQLPISKFHLLNSLYQEFGGLPLPLSREAQAEAVELAESIVASPVFDDDVKEGAKKWKTELLVHADDWYKMREELGSKSPLYHVLVSMQEEIQSLRQSLHGALARLNTIDQARFNHARRVVGLPPARSGHSTPPHHSAAMFATPAAIVRLSEYKLRDSIEHYLDEAPPEDATRDQLIRALRVCCGMEDARGLPGDRTPVEGLLRANSSLQFQNTFSNASSVRYDSDDDGEIS